MLVVIYDVALLYSDTSEIPKGCATKLNIMSIFDRIIFSRELNN